MPEVQYVLIVLGIAFLVLPCSKWIKVIWGFNIGFNLCILLIWFIPSSPIKARLDYLEAKQVIAQQPQAKTGEDCCGK
jgi:hypothetical protein